jgi:hypothetical protein
LFRLLLAVVAAVAVAVAVVVFLVLGFVVLLVLLLVLLLALLSVAPLLVVRHGGGASNARGFTKPEQSQQHRATVKACPKP